ELELSPELVLPALAAQLVEARRELGDVRVPEGRVADVAAGKAAEEAEAHRRARALAEEDEAHRAARPAGRERVFVADAAAVRAGAARVGHRAAKEVADRGVQLLALDVRPARA